MYWLVFAFEVRFEEDTAAEARWVGARVGATGVCALADLLAVVLEVVVVVVLTVVMLVALPVAAVVAVEGPDLLAIAEVERSAAGRRPSLDAEPPDEERGLCWLSGLPWSPFSAAVVFLMLTGGRVLGDLAAAEEDETAPAVAARCRMDRSEVEGLRLGLVVELREARWPGVWLRGIGGMVSVEMSRAKDTEGEAEGRAGAEASVGE